MRRSVAAVSLVCAVVLSCAHALAAPKADTKAIAAVIEDQFAGFRDSTRSTSAHLAAALP